MLLEYREGGFAVTEVAVVITEGETRGELSQVAFADGLTTQRAQTLSTGISPVHQDEFHMRPPLRPLPRNWLPTIFALEADPNVVPSSRQSGIGRCRSNLEWRELGNWNRTSSTLVRRSRAVGLVAGTCSSERHDAYSAAKLVADSVVQLVQQQLLLRGGSWEGSAVTLGILAVNSLRRYAATSVRIPCSGICSACGRTRRPPESPRGSDRLRPGRGPRRARRLERGQRRPERDRQE